MKEFVVFTNLKYNCREKTYKTVGTVLIRKKDIRSIEEDIAEVDGVEKTFSTIQTQTDSYYVRETARQIADILAYYGDPNFPPDRDTYLKSKEEVMNLVRDK